MFICICILEGTWAKSSMIFTKLLTLCSGTEEIEKDKKYKNYTATFIILLNRLLFISLNSDDAVICHKVTTKNELNTGTGCAGWELENYNIQLNKDPIHLS